ncbi:MAG: von Willebrand factor type A domain-containing protein [Planctomycetota bacterium]
MRLRTRRTRTASLATCGLLAGSLAALAACNADGGSATGAAPAARPSPSMRAAAPGAASGADSYGLGYLDLDMRAAHELDRSRSIDLEEAETVVADPRDRAEALLDVLRPREDETPEQYHQRVLMTRPFVETTREATSTFGLESDTASYTMARAQLEGGSLPSPWFVRPEEFVNYLDAELDPPSRGDFSASTDICPSPFGAEGAWLVRVGLRARDVREHARGRLAITFVVDTSGSMASPNRMTMVKSVLALLSEELDPLDQVAVVRYSDEASVLIPASRGDELRRRLDAIAELQPDGSTNIEAGLALGCKIANEAYDPEATNFVVLLSDGLGNVGETQADALLASTAESRSRGVHVNTVGVGMNARDNFLERLADAGDGRCDYVDSEKEARRAFVERFTGAFQVVAKDAKLQVEFDPACVGSWRLVGYENRALANADFRNDAADAGEIGAGHSVAAIYELEDVRFDGDRPLGEVRIRYVAEGRTDATEASWPIAMSGYYPTFDAAPRAMRAQILMAQFAELLSNSAHAVGDDPFALESAATALAAGWNDEAFAEAAQLVRIAAPLLAEREHELGPVEDAARQLAFATYQRLLEERRDPDGRSARVAQEQAKALEASFHEVASAEGK